VVEVLWAAGRLAIGQVDAVEPISIPAPA